MVQVILIKKDKNLHQNLVISFRWRNLVAGHLVEEKRFWQTLAMPPETGKPGKNKMFQ